MHLNEVSEMNCWNETMLSEEIAHCKKQQNSDCLENFLLNRLKDSDPFCISCRPRFWNELGLVMIREENVGMAEEYFNNSLALEPDNRTALFNLGTLLMQQGDLSGALKKYEVIISKQPDNFDALFNSGLCHLYRENKEAAAAFFIQAADLRPNDGQAQYLAGEMLLQLGQAKKALHYFRLAYKENPGHFETTQGFAISLLKTENYDEAIAVCDAALLNFGAATLPLQVKGDAMLALGRYEEAVMCHIDLCNLDLDIRDFVIARLQRLATEDPAAFMAYSTAGHDLFPNFESILKTVQTKG